MKFFVFNLALSLLLITGCVSRGGVYIEETMYSVKQHRIAATAAFGLVREVSQNGRVVFSAYHDRKFKNFEVTEKTMERYHSKATILGAIRPFRVKVEVIYEERDPDTGDWLVVENDEELAEKRAQVIKVMLNQSRDEARTFDEEMPF